MSSLAHAYLCCLAPICQAESAGNWNGEATFGGKLCIFTEYVIARNGVLLPPCCADADVIFIKIGKAQYTLGIAVHDLDQIGQRKRSANVLPAETITCAPRSNAIKRW